MHFDWSILWVWVCVCVCGCVILRESVERETRTFRVWKEAMMYVVGITLSSTCEGKKTYRSHLYPLSLLLLPPKCTSVFPSSPPPLHPPLPPTKLSFSRVFIILKASSAITRQVFLSHLLSKLIREYQVGHHSFTHILNMFIPYWKSPSVG